MLKTFGSLVEKHIHQVPSVDFVGIDRHMDLLEEMAKVQP